MKRGVLIAIVLSIMVIICSMKSNSCDPEEIIFKYIKWEITKEEVKNQFRVNVVEDRKGNLVYTRVIENINIESILYFSKSNQLNAVNVMYKGKNLHPIFNKFKKNFTKKYGNADGCMGDEFIMCFWREKNLRISLQYDHFDKKIANEYARDYITIIYHYSIPK